MERSRISWWWASRCPKHVEILLITDTSLFVASSWFLFYLTMLTSGPAVAICNDEISCSWNVVYALYSASLSLFLNLSFLAFLSLSKSPSLWTELQISFSLYTSNDLDLSSYSHTFCTTLKDSVSPNSRLPGISMILRYTRFRSVATYVSLICLKGTESCITRFVKAWSYV